MVRRKGNQQKRKTRMQQGKHSQIFSYFFLHSELIFLDEPTSGLDSYAAKAVMKSLRELVSENSCVWFGPVCWRTCFCCNDWQAWMGRTIVCTIHQPSSEIFRLFDNIMILAEGMLVNTTMAVAILTQVTAKTMAKKSQLWFSVSGQTVYFGPAGAQVLRYFSDIGYKCPKFINPADYLSK